MKLRPKYYPYPVLGVGAHDYKTVKFEPKLRIWKDMRDLKIEFHCELKNSGLESLLDEGKIAYACHVECSQTGFRKLYQLSSSKMSLAIARRNLHGRVEIRPFLTAVEDIPSFFNADLEDVFQEVLPIHVHQGSMLGIGQMEEVDVEGDDAAFRDAESIFSVVKSEQTGAYPDVEYDEKKIRITLPENTFNEYRSAACENIPAFLSMLLVPALLYVFYEIYDQLKEDNYDELGVDERYEENRWYVSLKRNYKKKNPQGSFIKEMRKPEKFFMLAQKFLDNPVVQATDIIVGEDDREERS